MDKCSNLVNEAASKGQTQVRVPIDEDNIHSHKEVAYVWDVLNELGYTVGAPVKATALGPGFYIKWGGQSHAQPR